MAKVFNNISGSEKPQQPVTRLQQLKAQAQTLRSEMTAERQRIREERDNRSQQIHVLTLLGKAVAHKGKSQIATVLEKTDCLTDDEKLAVEYYYGLRERPTKDAKMKANATHN